MHALAPLVARLRALPRNLTLFLIAMALLGTVGGIFETTFNNFLHDSFALGADARGFLEFPRELPGFLTALFAGMLAFLPETYIASASAALIGVGMLGLAAWGTNWDAMLLFMVLWSIGSHLIMPVRSSVAMALARPGEQGTQLGRMQGVSIAAGVGGCALVWVIMRNVDGGYRLLFVLGAVAALAASAVLSRIRLPGAHLERPRFVWRRDYWLYYVLSFFFGARKQIFITFGPWVLVKIFEQPAFRFAQLWIVASVLGVVLQPALGRAIDRFGERAVLVADAVLVFLVCLGYGCAHLLPGRGAALALLYSCFVGDQLLFGVGMARDTYLSKIALRREDVAPTLSLGVSINHIVSMSIPALGGLLWMRCGHGAVFLVAAGIAVVMGCFALLVRTPARVAPAGGRALPMA
jgi:MFS family permease